MQSKFKMIAFRGEKKFGPRSDWSPLGFNSKFPTSIPAPFIWEPPPGFNRRVSNKLDVSDQNASVWCVLVVLGECPN